jgi:uncharacterized protein YjdB
VEPVFSAITVTGPTTLAVGGSTTLTATGTAVGGDNLPALTVPVGDPASHVWSSDNPRIATVDRNSGKVTAHRPGTVHVSVTTGGLTEALTITVG